MKTTILNKPGEFHLMEAGKIDTAPCLPHCTDFEHLAEVFTTFVQPDQELIKAVIEI